MESDKSYFLHQKSIDRNHLVNFYKNDTTGISYRDTLIYFLLAENELNSRYELVIEYFYNQDYSNASSVLASIPSEFTLSDQENDIYNKYQNYLSVLINLKQNNKFIDDLDTNQISLLNSFATDLYSLPDAYARNALIYIEELAYSEPYILPDSTLKEEEYHSASESQNKKLPAFEIYPNPANSYITIEYDIQSQAAIGYIEIFNIDGRMIEKVELSSTNSSIVLHIGEKYITGMYLCRLVCNGEVIGSEKLTIIK